jgi:hypothetical protein
MTHGKKKTWMPGVKPWHDEARMLRVPNSILDFRKIRNRARGGADFIQEF